MKRFLCLCMIFVLLSGCAGPAAPAHEAETPVTEPAVERELLTKIAGGEYETAVYTAMLYTLGENLLMASWTAEGYDEQRQETTEGAYLTVISPEDGSVQANSYMTLGQFLDPQITGNYVTMVDAFSGGLGSVLDSELSQVEFDTDLPKQIDYELDLESTICEGYWLSPDLQKVYVLYARTMSNSYDLICIDLQAKTSTTMIDEMHDAWITYEDEQYVIFTYYDYDLDRWCCPCLDLSSGQLEDAPAEGTVFGRVGDVWLLKGRDGAYTTCVLTSNENSTCSLDRLYDPETETLPILLGGKHLFVSKGSGEIGTLYDVSEQLVSRYEFPEQTNVAVCQGAKPVWNEAAQGYYLLSYDENAWELYFWDIRAEFEMPAEPNSTETPAEPVAPESMRPATEGAVLTKLSDNVLDTPVDTAQLYTLGENLLIRTESEFYDAQKQGFVDRDCLTLVYPGDGSVLAICENGLLDGYDLKITGEYVTLVDTYWGQIGDVLDSSLTPLETYIPTAEVLPIEIDCEKGYCDGYWLSADLQRLYVLYSPEPDAAYDLFCVDLKTDTVTPMVADMQLASAAYEDDRYVVLNYYTAEGPRVCSLDLHTGELDWAPMNVWPRARQGSTWLMQDKNDTYTFYVCTPEGVKTYPLGEIIDEQTRFQYNVATNIFLPSEQHLFLRGGDYGWSGTLYDVSGNFISHYEFPELLDDPSCTVSVPVWSEAADGYYLLLNTGKTCELYFWDIEAEVEPQPDLD